TSVIAANVVIPRRNFPGEKAGGHGRKKRPGSHEFHPLIRRSFANTTNAWPEACLANRLKIFHSKHCVPSVLFLFLQTTMFAVVWLKNHVLIESC
ncbi:unnamed protein product, partial [Heterotrigona itama]